MFCWTRVAKFGQLGFITDPHIFFPESWNELNDTKGLENIQISILHKYIAGRYRPVSYPDGPITARYRFM